MLLCFLQLCSRLQLNLVSDCILQLNFCLFFVLKILSFSQTCTYTLAPQLLQFDLFMFLFLCVGFGTKTTFGLAFTHILEYLQLQRYSSNEKQQKKNIYLTDKLPSVTFPPPHSTTTSRRSTLLQQTSSQRLLPELPRLPLTLRSTVRGGHFHLESRVGWCQMVLPLPLVATRWTSTRVASWTTASVISVDHHHQLVLELWMLFCHRKRLARGARSDPVVRQPALCCIAAGCSPEEKLWMLDDGDNCAISSQMCIVFE